MSKPGEKFHHFPCEHSAHQVPCEHSAHHVWAVPPLALFVLFEFQLDNPAVSLLEILWTASHGFSIALKQPALKQPFTQLWRGENGESHCAVGGKVDCRQDGQCADSWMATVKVEAAQAWGAGGSGAGLRKPPGASNRCAAVPWSVMLGLSMEMEGRGCVGG